MNRAALLPLLLTVQVLCAQDADRFFATRLPAVMDPSRSGFDPGLRVAMVHQDQWLQVPGAWRNELVNVDLSLRDRRKSVGTWMGAGLEVATDRSPASNSNRTHAALRSAIHLRSGSRSFLSAGLGTALVNAVYNDLDGAWGSQYNGSRYDPSLSSGETWSNDASTWLDARAGFSFTLKRAAESQYRREPNILTAGLAADHLGRILLRNGAQLTEPTPIRATAYLLGEQHHEIWDNGYFAGELVAQTQGPFHSARSNLYAGRHLLNASREKGGATPVGFKVGLGYRYGDALLMNGALEFGRFNVGMAYGWAVAEPDHLAAGRRTFEFMVQWSSF